MLRTRVARIAVVAMSSLLLPLCAQAGEIVIGQVAPFSGTLAPTGKGVNLGVRAYLARVNAAGGVRGDTLRLVTRDDGYKVEETVRLTRELIDTEQPAALVGFVGTGNTIALHKEGVLDKARIALVGVRSGAQALREPVPRYIFHTRASYAAEVQRVIDQMKSMGLQRVAVFHQDDPFGQDGLSAARARLETAGIELVAVGSYPKGTTEVASAVSTIHAADPNGVIMVSNTAASAAFVKEMKAAGSYALMIALSVTTGPQVAERIGAGTAHGLGIVQVVPNPASEAIAISRELGEDLKRIDAAGEANHTVLEGYLMARVLVEGIRRAGANDRAAIHAALDNLGTFDAGGVTIRYRPDSHDGATYTDISILNRAGQLLR
jgi:ABC-type branched-subunit amino acid transport system substrate-binding protein